MFGVYSRMNNALPGFVIASVFRYFNKKSIVNSIFPSGFSLFKPRSFASLHLRYLFFTCMCLLKILKVECQHTIKWKTWILVIVSDSIVLSTTNKKDIQTKVIHVFVYSEFWNYWACWYSSLSLLFFRNKKLITKRILHSTTELWSL